MPEEEPTLDVVARGGVSFAYAGWESVCVKTWIIRTLFVGFVGEGVVKEESSAMVTVFSRTLTLMVMGFFLAGRGVGMIVVDPLEVVFSELLGTWEY